MSLRDVRLAQLRVLLKEEKEHRTKLAARIGKSPAQLSQWLSGYRTITEETAREIARKAGKPFRWLDNAADTSDPPSSAVVAHEMSPTPYTLPFQMTWEAVMQADELPDRFVLPMPDAALHPKIVKGTELIFSRATPPAPGLGVLVQDQGGRRYIRRYAEGLGGAWVAQAINGAYATLESDRDGLQLLAVMTGRLDGSI